MKRARTKIMERTAKYWFGRMYLARGVVLIRSSSQKAFQKIRGGCDKAPADVYIQQYAHRRAVLLRPSPADRTIDAMLKASISVDSLVRKLLRVEAARAIPGYSLSGQNVPPFIFPTGAIFMLVDPKLINDVMRDVRRFPLQSIRRIPRTPALRVELRPGQEGRAGFIEEQVSRVPGVIAATADFSYYGPYKQIIHQSPNDEPPIVDSASFLRRNLVDRAWEFGMGNEGIDVAVIDSNFYDHPDLTYRFDHGYDAADGDHDPRSPLSPPDADVSQPGLYRHGTEMSGVIASHGTVNPQYGTGVSPHSKIVPIRATDVSVDPMDNAQAFLDEWVNEWIQAMIEIFYSGVPVVNASITLGLNPEVIPYSWHAWLNWLTGLPQGPQVFMSASAGNDPDSMQVSYLAKRPFVFGVGWADRESDQRLGNGGVDLDISVVDGTWGVLEPNGEAWSIGTNSGGTSVSAAIASGVGSLIGAQGKYNSLDITEILRWTAARSAKYEATADANGQSPELGYGYLDAFAAVKQAHKGKGTAGRVVPIKFLPGGGTLVEQMGDNPWFWCLVPRNDASGNYWGHWKSTNPFTDISAGANAKGTGLVVGDFNGDGLDEIAVQQAGTRTNRFDIVHYNANQENWYRMGPSQDNMGSALVWGAANPPIYQVFGADVDADGRVELVANRGGKIELAKSTSQNRWAQFGPTMASLQLFDPRGLLRHDEEIKGATVLALSLHRWHRPSLHRDLILALSVVLVNIAKNEYWLFPPALHYRTVTLETCSLHQFVGNTWVPKPLDAWETTHLPIPFTRNVIVADIDGDAVDEAVLLYPDDHYKMITIDISDPIASATSGIGYITVSSDWSWPGAPSELVPAAVEANGRHELAYLDSDDTSNRVRFLRWDPIARSWNLGRTFSKKKLGNTALRLQAGDFDGDGIDEIALLMAKPFGNTYHVFRFTNNQFILAGEL